VKDLRANARQRIFAMLLLLLALILGSLLVAVALPQAIVWSSRRLIYTRIEDIPARRVAIVFGAGIWPDGRLSDVLADRVSTAVALYQAGKVEKLLMTGDNRFVDYNEPQRMKEYALSLGMPEQDIVLDYAGRRTYDSCYRAKEIFEAPNAILVTQRFHLPRALYTCNGLGLESVGVTADRRSYQRIRWFTLREQPAILMAWWEVMISHPEPVLGDKLPLFPD
jgi:SanA protein